MHVVIRPTHHWAWYHYVVFLIGENVPSQSKLISGHHHVHMKPVASDLEFRVPRDPCSEF